MWEGDRLYIVTLKQKYVNRLVSKESIQPQKWGCLKTTLGGSIPPLPAELLLFIASCIQTRTGLQGCTPSRHTRPG